MTYYICVSTLPNKDLSCLQYILKLASSFKADLSVLKLTSME